MNCSISRRNIVYELSTVRLEKRRFGILAGSCLTVCKTFCRWRSILAASTKSDVNFTPHSVNATLIEDALAFPAWNASFPSQFSTGSCRNAGSMFIWYIPNQQSLLARSAYLVVGVRTGNIGLQSLCQTVAVGTSMADQLACFEE